MQYFKNIGLNSGRFRRLYENRINSGSLSVPFSAFSRKSASSKSALTFSAGNLMFNWLMRSWHSSKDNDPEPSLSAFLNCLLRNSLNFFSSSKLFMATIKCWMTVTQVFLILVVSAIKSKLGVSSWKINSIILKVKKIPKVWLTLKIIEKQLSLWQITSPILGVLLLLFCLTKALKVSVECPIRTSLISRKSILAGLPGPGPVKRSILVFHW